MSAVLFGSIGTLVDASELQRQSFNQAFADSGLDWNWSRDDYVAMLESSGGRDRVKAFAEQQGQEVDADAIHQAKSEIFRERLATSDATARPGVVDTVKAAKEAGAKVALVTTTSAENVGALFDALDSELSSGSFDLVVDTSDVADPKPDAAAYRYALEHLGEDAGSCVAIEDNEGGVEAAAAAGIACVAFPNENTASHEFGNASGRVERVDFEELRGVAGSASA